MRTPSELARYARRRARVGEPLYLVQDIVRAFGIGLSVRPGLAKSGMLDLIDGRIAIVVNKNGSEAQRFSAAHELGHYLLALEEDRPLIDQIHDRKVEQYCNSFASHLLLPETWLRREAAHKPHGFEAAFEVAESAQVSLATAIFALNDRADWSRDLLKWKRAAGDWQLTIAPPMLRRRGLRSTPHTKKALEIVSDRSTRLRVPFASDDGPINLEVDLLYTAGTILGLLPERASGHSIRS